MFCRGAVFSNPHQSLTAMDPTDKVQLGLPGVVSHLPGVCHDPAYAISCKTLMTLPDFTSLEFQLVVNMFNSW